MKDTKLYIPVLTLSAKENYQSPLLKHWKHQFTGMNIEQKVRIKI